MESTPEVCPGSPYFVFGTDSYAHVQATDMRYGSKISTLLINEGDQWWICHSGPRELIGLEGPENIPVLMMGLNI